MPLGAALFDLNGTLLDQSLLAEPLGTRGACRHVRRLVRAAPPSGGLPVGRRDPPAFGGLAETMLATTFARLGVSAEPADVSACQASYRSSWNAREGIERTWPFPGAVPRRAGGLAEAARMLVSARS
jgi:hypothetical protein